MAVIRVTMPQELALSHGATLVKGVISMMLAHLVSLTVFSAPLKHVEVILMPCLLMSKPLPKPKQEKMRAKMMKKTMIPKKVRVKTLKKMTRT